jgi:hypothetical protein
MLSNGMHKVYARVQGEAMERRHTVEEFYGYKQLPVHSGFICELAYSLQLLLWKEIFGIETCVQYYYFPIWGCIVR